MAAPPAATGPAEPDHTHQGAMAAETSAPSEPARRPANGGLAEILGAKDLWLNLTLRELRGKYKRSALGWAWSLLNPLATMAIFTFVFYFVIRVQPPPGDPSGLNVFALFLLCGLLPWNYLSNSVVGGTHSLVGNGSLIKKVYFPRVVLVGASTASWLFSLLIELSLLAVVLLIVGNMVLPWLPGVALLLLLQTVFVLGLALAFAVLNVYFRDMAHLVGIGMQFWFFATPIIYPIELVRAAAQDAPWVLFVYELNPMTRFVEAYRDLLYDLRLPPAGDLAYLVGVSVATLAAGYLLFRRFEPRLAEEL